MSHQQRKYCPRKKLLTRLMERDKMSFRGSLTLKAAMKCLTEREDTGGD
jgi:hypothetical protein